MSNIAHETSRIKRAINVLRDNAIIKMLFGNNDLLSDDDILDKYANYMQNTEISETAKELKTSLYNINSKIEASQKRENLEKYKFSGKNKKVNDKSSLTNKKDNTLPSKAKTHEDDEYYL